MARLVAAIASCASAKAVLAGNQTLAAILFRSEAQDKAKSSDYCRNEHAQCRLRRNTLPRRSI